MRLRSSHSEWWKPVVAGLLLAGSAVRPADLLQWDMALNRVDADIHSCDLVTVLEKVSRATGWQIFLEPGTERTVSTKFQNRPPDRALDLLLGDLNRVLLPATNGAPRLLVFRTTEQQATQRIKGKPDSRRTSDPIPDELVVTVKPGTDIEELARQLGAKVAGRLGSSNTYRLKFETAEAAAAARRFLEGREEVASVDYNYPVARDLPSSLYGETLPLNLKPGTVADKDRIIVGLIDTMIDAEKGGLKDLVLPGVSVVGDSTHPGGEPLHGDTMAQTFFRAVAMVQGESDGTPIRLLSVNVYGNRDFTTTWDVTMGVYEAINRGARVINLSLGSEGSADYLHQAIRFGREQGVLFFAAAGNEPGTTVYYPAAYDEVFAVTAADPNGSISAFANSGRFVDLGAAGYGAVYFDGRVWRVAGTSVSTANASGIAAVLLQRTGMNPRLTEALLREKLAVNGGVP